MIKIAEKSNEKVVFNTDIPISLANAIRRSINSIPILAIDELEISKNDSALYDEVIAHRMGLVPIKNPDLKLPEDCSCNGKGCNKCSIKYKLKAKGPCTVYSDELSPKGDVSYKMPITILDKDQELEFVAIAKMGIGENHAKFSPGLFFYKYKDDVDDLEINDEKFKKLVESTGKDNNQELIVEIESWGQLNAKDIFIKAVDTLNKDIKEFSKQIK